MIKDYAEAKNVVHHFQLTRNPILPAQALYLVNDLGLCTVDKISNPAGLIVPSNDMKKMEHNDITRNSVPIQF